MSDADEPTPQPQVRAVPGNVLPTIAIVGRPNVGKSTLFNRLIRRRQAIVRGEPGTTRDRNYGSTEWRGRHFTVVDTGGLLGEQLSGPYADSVADQVQQVVAEADAIVLVVDVQAGALPADDDVAALLREVEQPVTVCANKADNPQLAATAGEFFSLGLGEPIAISAHHGRHIDDLLDEVTEQLAVAEPRQEEPSACRLAIIGRPNVGKSSLVNALLRDERMIVSDVPGTTRDAVDTLLSFDGEEVALVDTAGIRRRGRVAPGIERASVRRAGAAVRRADVAAVVIDANEGVTSQDLHVLGMALDDGAGIVIVMNKADLVDAEEGLRNSRERQLAGRARFVNWAPIVWVSALTGDAVDSVVGAALHVAAERRKRVPTPRLNAMLKQALIDRPPSTYRGRPIRFYYAVQTEIEPPTFLFFVNYPEAVHFSYERFLLGRIRRSFGFEGVTLRCVLRGREPKPGDDSMRTGRREAAGRRNQLD